MGSANQSPDQYIEQYIVEPLLAFRKHVSPLNQNYIEGVAQFAKTISDLLTGLDGAVALQGPGANALGDLISTYLDGEEKLAGSFPDLLQGRLLDTSVLCEKYAHQLESSLILPAHHTHAGGGGGNFSASALFPLDSGNGGSGDSTAVASAEDEFTPALEGLTRDLESGPINEELRPTPELGPKVQVDPTLPANYADFWKMLGIMSITTTGAAVLITGAIILKNLTDPELQLLNEVQNRLGPGSYNVTAILVLISAGYKDPDIIAAIVKEGLSPLFSDPDIAQLMSELTPEQQKRVLAIVAAHPGLTVEQLRNFLRYTKMKCTYNRLINDILGHDPTDPVAQDIARKFPKQVQELVNRMNANVGNKLNSEADPFNLTDDKLNGWYSHMTGPWGEWATIEQYYMQGKLVDFSTPLSPDGEVDLKINENGVEKWMEVKNVRSLKSSWKKIIEQAQNYAAQGAKDVVIDLPQQTGPDDPSGPSQQQMNAFNNNVRKLYPAVKFEIKYGPPDPGKPIPFDPPSKDWGKCLPLP